MDVNKTRASQSLQQDGDSDDDRHDAGRDGWFAAFPEVRLSAAFPYMATARTTDASARLLPLLNLPLAVRGIACCYDRNRGSSRMAATLAAIKSQLDAAFATVQLAMTARSFGHEDARVNAARCVSRTTREVKEALGEGHLSPSEIRLLEAKLSALGEASRRIPASSQ